MKRSTIAILVLAGVVCILAGILLGTLLGGGEPSTQPPGTPLPSPSESTSPPTGTPSASPGEALPPTGTGGLQSTDYKAKDLLGAWILTYLDEDMHTPVLDLPTERVIFDEVGNITVQRYYETNPDAITETSGLYTLDARDGKTYITAPIFNVGGYEMEWEILLDGDGLELLHFFWTINSTATREKITIHNFYLREEK